MGPLGLIQTSIIFGSLQGNRNFSLSSSIVRFFFIDLNQVNVDFIELVGRLSWVISGTAWQKIAGYAFFIHCCIFLEVV